MSVSVAVSEPIHSADCAISADKNLLAGTSPEKIYTNVYDTS